MANKKDKKEDIVLEEWTDEIEAILIEWSEKALCYRWLHNESKKIFEELNNRYIIPIIICSTLTGTISIGMNSIVPDNYIIYTQVSVGFINIFIGILSTLLNFFKYAEKKQSHENSSILWYKFYRDITTELALKPEKRRNVNDFFKIYRAEYDNIISQSLDLDEDIVYLFNRKFKKEIKKGDIHFPEIISHIQKSKDYQHYLFERKIHKDNMIKMFNKDENEGKEEMEENKCEHTDNTENSKYSKFSTLTSETKDSKDSKEEKEKEKFKVSNMIRLFEGRI